MERTQVSAAELRAEHSPVSERFVAVELGDGTVIYDSSDADRWLLSDAAVERSEMR